ncbi:MAG: polysialyltransferase family glycosyltransferase [Methanoregula sp.]
MKKKILIAFVNPYIFYGAITPLIPKLSNSFDIFVITTNFFLNDNFSEQLVHWKKEKIISDYLVVPVYVNNSTGNQNVFKTHFFMRLKIKYLRKQTFDIFIGDSSIYVWERYLIDCTLPPACIRIGLHTYSTATSHPFLVEGIMNGEPAADLMKNVAFPWSIKQNEISESLVKKNPIFGIYSKFLKSSSKSQFIKKGIIYAINGFGLLNRFTHIIDHYFIPALFVQKVFPLRKYDNPTYFDTDSFKYIIVCQKFSELFCRSLYKNSQVYLAQHPLAGTCRCHLAQQPEPDIVLVCLSGYDGTANQSELLYRDLQIVISESNTKKIHIKPHPRERGPYLEELKVYLQEKGIVVTVMDVDSPIREIACEYKGIVGCASTSLLEARSACNYAFVVGFFAISQTISKNNPKYVVGDINHLEKQIDWIEEDGSYNPDIFQRRNHPANPYPTIPEILTEISGNSTK